MHKQKRGGVHEGGGGFQVSTDYRKPLFGKNGHDKLQPERVAMLRVRLSNCQIPLLFYNIFLQRLLTTKTPGFWSPCIS